MKRRLILFSLLIAVFSTAYNQEKLEVEGAVIIGNSTDGTTLSPGTIRFNSTTNDFEGWNGQWISLAGSFGPIGSGMVTDIDGNQYVTGTIGTQTWMRENLRVTHYRNGDQIPEVLLNSTWFALSEEAWSWYDHDPERDNLHGKMYNWYAVADARGLCPTGWHVPSDTEWTTLTDLLGGIAVAGAKMKTTGTISAGTGYWNDPNTGATNESGFTGLPGGNRDINGSFFNLGNFGFWWCGTESSSLNAWARSLQHNSGAVLRFNNDKNFGFSVRCVRD